MKFNKFKILTLLLTSIVIFSACEDDEGDKGTALGDIVGKWDLIGLTGEYTRTIAFLPGWPTDTSIVLTASWKDAANVLGAAAPLFAQLVDQTLASWADDAVAPGFPKIAIFDKDGLAAYGIAMRAVFSDAESADDWGTYTINGTYPTIRTNLTTCATALTIPQIGDQGDYKITYTANNVGTLTLAGDVNLGDQVLPPFDDGVVTFTEEDGEVHELKIKFLDRDAHDVRYGEIQDSWSEDADRVIMGVNEVYVNRTTGNFQADSTGATMGAEGYIMDAALAPWSGYLTWYAFNILAEIGVKAVAVKNPLTDLDGDGDIDATDMVIYMHADNLASGGGVTGLGMPYLVLVDSFTDKLNPVPTNDSGSDFSAASPAAGGKLMYAVNPVCFPINELIDFDSDWEIVHDH